ncbi:hypothetical protein M406DRAFT_257103 [Cryphonectria parasitica EP155]|uniref:Trichothecene 3-O-acetyltransferase-like N-terminal domain-containing protein n=1 Tax=Cryphonectria parasitica (strain ATCC 38755 / EP155) TaxID=660469 RepID=A0A9P4Y2K4_CRYP1|nr:uncharacterized protein M406DRAFT_257103 [Cryphonectria parasitica EP155]KAF3765280.1 hypothetical protein M406DRAFT_257103 [Cryphonectria parasitica EP155]
MGQFPVLNAFSVLAYGFELPLDVDRDAVASALRASFDKLVEQIPFLGYQVDTRESDGVRKATPWPQDVAREGVRIRICDDGLPSMQQLLVDKVPVSKLDGKLLCPWPAFPFPHGIKGPVPIVHLQASFIRGGLILNLSAHHTFMDGTADFQFLKLLAIVLNGGKIPAADLEQANRPRDRVVSLIPHGEPVKDYSCLYPPPGWKFTMPTSWPKWCYFLMPEDSLSNLAETVRADAGLLSSSDPSDPKQRLSKDDVLSAFLWKRLCGLRIARGMPAETMSKLSRAINARNPLGIPSSYLGAHVAPCIVRLPMGRVDEMSVAQVARFLREELVEATTAWAIRSLATTVAREPPAGRARLLYTGTHNAATDIGCTNVSRALVPKGPWGSLGPCRWYRRPDAAPIPGSLRLQEAEDGVHPIAFCLPEEDLAALKEDEQWNRYATYIG